MAESCASLLDLCIREWDVDIIHTEVEHVVCILAIVDQAAGLKMNFGEKIPLTAIISKDSFQSEVDAFKNDMSKVVMMDPEAFFDSVHPAW